MVSHYALAHAWPIHLLLHRWGDGMRGHLSQAAEGVVSCLGVTQAANKQERAHSHRKET